MKEHERARQWRIATGLTPHRLSELVGYSVESIYAMERGEAPNSPNQRGQPVKPRVWRRYKCACAAVDAFIKLNHTFDWGAK